MPRAYSGPGALKYKPEFAKFAYEMCLLGATLEVIARALEVNADTIMNWQKNFPEFDDAVKAGREVADAKVAATLYQRAIGYSHTKQKVFCDPKTASTEIVEYTEHYPPDTASMIFWLKNRRPHEWRDIRQHEIGRPGEFASLSDAELREKAIQTAEALGMSGMVEGLRQGNIPAIPPPPPTNEGPDSVN